MIGLPAVVSSCADHVFVVVGEADVGHMRRVAEVALVFGLQTETKQTCVRLINLVLDTKNKLNLSLQTQKFDILRDQKVKSLTSNLRLCFFPLVLMKPSTPRLLHSFPFLPPNS